MTGLTDGEAAMLAARHVSAFNAAVAAGSYADFLQLFSDHAVIRFENVPGAGELQFAGRDAYARAYAEQPPDDQIDICGPARPDGQALVVPLAWRRDGLPGTMRLTFSDGPPDVLDDRLVTEMTVVFG